MFDYEKFKSDIAAAMEKSLRKWAEENDDIYIISLDLSRDMTSVGVWANTLYFLNKQCAAVDHLKTRIIDWANTMNYLDEQDYDALEDYWYFKYCEQEWELCEAFEDISSYMRAFTEENGEQFGRNYTYTEIFDEHCDKMAESCKKALEVFKGSVNKDFPELLITFNINEYLDDDERVKVFSLVNSKKAAEEYMKHIADFNQS